MSRPWSSVPSRYLRDPPSLHDGGRRASLSSSVVRSNGLCGATQPANSDANTQTKAMKAAAIATGELRKLWPISLSRKRATRPMAGGVVDVLIDAAYGLTVM